MHGFGLQTWEYSPVYALRSYAYAGLHAVVAAAGAVAFPSSKVMSFYVVRCVLAVASAGAETAMYSAVRDHPLLGPAVAVALLAILVPAAGLFVAAAGAVQSCVFYYYLF